MILTSCGVSTRRCSFHPLSMSDSCRISCFSTQSFNRLTADFGLIPGAQLIANSLRLKLLFMQNLLIVYLFQFSNNKIFILLQIYILFFIYTNIKDNIFIINLQNFISTKVFYTNLNTNTPIALLYKCVLMRHVSDICSYYHRLIRVDIKSVPQASTQLYLFHSLCINIHTKQTFHAIYE